MTSLHQAWETIPLDSDFITITASEVKALSGQEPRLMMKWDHSSKLPPALAASGRFILPLKNGVYAILKGQGYHKPEPCPEPINFPQRIPFHLETSQSGLSEMQHLDLAFNSGIISEFTSQPTLFPTLRGRKYSPAFSFKVGSRTIEVEGVQIEIDQGYEGPDCIIVVEAKIRECADFHLRQLYYPYRAWSTLSNKKVRSIFFTFEPETNIYRLREYAFEPSDTYQPPTLLKACAYRLVDAPAAKPIQASVKQTLPLPQADKLSRLAQIPLLLALGYDTPQSLSQRLNFDLRQGRYYLDAACSLGLVKKKPYRLSQLGQEYVLANASNRREILARSVLRVPIVQEFFIGLLLTPEGKLFKKDLEELIVTSSKLKPNTAARRAQTIWAWLSHLCLEGSAFSLKNDAIALKERPKVYHRQADQLRLFS